MNWKKGVTEKYILVDHLLHPLTFILFLLSLSLSFSFFYSFFLPLSLHWNESHFWSSESLLFFFLFITILNPFSFHLISLIEKEKKMKGRRRQGVEKRSFDLQHIFSWFSLHLSFFHSSVCFSLSFSFFCLFLSLSCFLIFFLFSCHYTYTVVSFWNLVFSILPNLSLFIFHLPFLTFKRWREEWDRKEKEWERKEGKKEREKEERQFVSILVSGGVDCLKIMFNNILLMTNKLHSHLLLSLSLSLSHLLIWFQIL